MIDEGHTLANHSQNHLDMTELSDDPLKFNEEILVVERKFKEVTGRELTKLFRPPYGRYSEESLIRAKKLGYKSVFWSYCYTDYYKDNQPPVDSSKRDRIRNLHPGGIYLLHSFSQTNADMMDSLIKEIKAEGYELKALE